MSPRIQDREMGVQEEEAGVCEEKRRGRRLTERTRGASVLRS